MCNSRNVNSKINSLYERCLQIDSHNDKNPSFKLVLETHNLFYVIPEIKRTV